MYIYLFLTTTWNSIGTPSPTGQILHAATHQEFSFSEELLQCISNSNCTT